MPALQPFESWPCSSATNYLFPSSREVAVTMQRSGVGCLALPGLWCWEQGYKIPTTLPSSRGSGMELEGMKCKWEEGAYFQISIPNHSDGCKQTFFTKAFWDSGLHHWPPAGIPLPFTSRSGHLVGFERGMPIIFLASLPAGKMTHASSMSMCLVYLTCITHHLGRNSTCCVLSPFGHLAENAPSLSPSPQTWDLTSSQLQSWLLLESVFQRIHFPTEDCPQVHPKRDRRRRACSVSEGRFPNGVKGYLPVPMSLDSDKLLF